MVLRRMSEECRTHAGTGTGIGRLGTRTSYLVLVVTMMHDA